MTPPLTPVDLERLNALYSGGMTISQVAIELDVSRYVVRHRLRALGIKARGKRVRTAEEIDAAVDAYVGGMFGDRAARLCRMTRTTFIAEVLQPRGIRVRERGECLLHSLPAGQAPTVELLYRSGMGVASIARRLEVSVHPVRRALTAAGLTTRDRGSANRGPDEFGRFTNPRGYVSVGLLPTHPRYDMVNGDDYVLEHRLVMATALGRALTAAETVHHIDGVKSHNQLGNLQLRTGSHGQGIVLSCRCCGSQDIAAVPIADPDPPVHPAKAATYV